MATILLFGGSFAPWGFAFCDGAVLHIMENAALFSLLGTTYGGDGKTTFALPDLRHAEPKQTKDATAPRYIICTSGIFPARS